MYISKFHAKNYKSIYDSGKVNLGPGINIITGQNSVGKSALLKMLSLRFADTPHKSTKTIPTPTISKPDPTSEIEIEFIIPIEELKTYIFEGNFSDFLIEDIGITNHIDRRNFLANVTSGVFFDNIGPKVKIYTKFKGAALLSAYFVDHGKADGGNYYSFHIDKATKKLSSTGIITPDVSSTTSYSIAQNLASRIYAFSAERLNIGSSRFGTSVDLNNNASNLPEVLNILQSDKFKFERYNKYFTKIFPQIYQVCVRPDPNGTHVQILLYNEDPKLERTDLLVPLAESGTGIGQVLAILYVVLTSEIPKIIIIDEPNSFLHPGASRKLIEILKEHPQHQFIIATHSPSTISAANPSSIHVIKYENAMSSILEIDMKETQNQIYYLAEIGSKLSDVFGSDNILWVEGKTEELCFPKIIEKTPGLSLMGTTILGVKHTGDFERKDAQTIFSIYEKLSNGKGLLPAAIGFIFDREKRSKQEMEDIARQSKNHVVFTNRKMFENYLLNSGAILSVMNSEQGISIAKKEIEEWLANNKWNSDYIIKKIADEKNEAKWLNEVDSAKLLTALFSDVSQNKLSFDKIKHSVGLCDWILENSIGDLQEIQELLKKFLEAK
jgi:AAA15 family ATPase/GTPase